LNNIHTTLSDFLNENNSKKKEVNQIIKKLKSKEAFEILDGSKAPDTTFQYGGCWILADALSMYYYDIPVYVIYNKIRNRIEHFFVKINSMYLDSDGIQTEQQMIKKVAIDDNYNIDDLSIIKYDGQEYDGIIRDLNASKKLVNFFNK
jgi:hypothetical protein